MDNEKPARIQTRPDGKRETKNIIGGGEKPTPRISHPGKKITLASKTDGYLIEMSWSEKKYYQQEMRNRSLLTEQGCWEWVGHKTPKGYGRLSYRNKQVGSHRVSFTAFGGKVSLEKPHVLHSCNNPCCVNPDHLRAGSPQENHADKVKSGHHLIGDRHPMRVLSSPQVLAIRKKYAEFPSQHRLAKEFNVGRTTIQKIVRREIWAHI